MLFIVHNWLFNKHNRLCVYFYLHNWLLDLHNWLRVYFLSFNDMWLFFFIWLEFIWLCRLSTLWWSWSLRLQRKSLWHFGLTFLSYLSYWWRYVFVGVVVLFLNCCDCFTLHVLTKKVVVGVFLINWCFSLWLINIL